jgi:hypothetical protein
VMVLSKVLVSTTPIGTSIHLLLNITSSTQRRNRDMRCSCLIVWVRVILSPLDTKVLTVDPNVAGTGKSSHPDGTQEVQAGVQVEIAHQLVQKIRSGSTGLNFGKLVGLGHSFGRLVGSSLLCGSKQAFSTSQCY